MPEENGPKTKETPKTLADTVRDYALAEERPKTPEALKTYAEQVEVLCQKVAKLEANALTPVELGDPRVFAKYDGKGKLIAVKAQIPLREDLGELYEVKGKVAISSAGYHSCNRYAGLSLVGPLHVQTPDGEQPNPWMEREPKTGFVREVWVRRVAFGLGPTGNLAIVDRTIHFNIRAYLLQALVAKMKQKPDSAKWTTEDGAKTWQEEINKKRKADSKPEAQVWFMLMEPPIGLAVDLSDAGICEAFEEHTQRLRFAERHATSICERKALQAHPAIAKTQVDHTGPIKARRAVVTVFGFRHDLDKKAVERLAIAVAEGDEGRLQTEAAALGVGQAEVQVAREEATAEDVQAAETQEGDEGGAPRETPESAAAASPPPSPEASPSERAQLLEQIKLARSALKNEKDFNVLVGKAGIISLLSHAPIENLKTLLTSISRAVDQAAAKS